LGPHHPREETEAKHYPAWRCQRQAGSAKQPTIDRIADIVAFNLIIVGGVAQW